MPYAAPSDLMLRYDRTSIGQLCGDDKRAVSPVDLPTDPVCLGMLNDASGMVDAALLVGNRYSPSDLTSLTANSNFLLIRVTCDIAMALLCDRRPGWNPERSKAIHELADSHLEKLRTGENTFNIQASMDAGEPVDSGPLTMNYQANQLNNIVDRSRAYYGERLVPFNR